MLPLFLTLYGIYLLMVGAKGNGGEFVDAMGEDIRGYGTWIIAILVLAIMSEVEGIKGAVKPFVVLLVLNFALRNWSTIETQIKSL